MAIGTGLERNLVKECQLVRGAILYGDRAVVYSPFLALLRSTTNIRTFTAHQLFKLTMNVAPHAIPSEVFNEIPNQILRHLQGTSSESLDDLSVAHRTLLRQIEDLLQQTLQSTVTLAHENESTPGMADLILVEREGLLDIHDFQLPSKGDALVEHMSRILQTFVTGDASPLIPEAMKFLAGYLHLAFSGDTYPILDSGVSNMLLRTIPSPALSAEAAARARHGQLSAIILDHLPSPQAPMEEILELRTTLQPYLPAFRGRLAEFASQMGQQPWSPDFQREAERLFMERVEPELALIRTLVRKWPTSKMIATAVGATGIGISLAPLFDISDLIRACFGLTISASASITAQWSEKKDIAEKNGMFFFYAAESALLSRK